MHSFNSLALLCLTCQLAAADCAPDNCIRAVTGTARQMSDNKYNDCQSYMQCTVTPVAAQVTVTVDATAKVLANGRLQAGHKKRHADIVQRQASPTAITNCPTLVPTYASVCSGPVRYSSACSCRGLTASTTTLATGTTITQTSTRVVMPQPASDSPPASNGAGTSNPTPASTFITSVVSASESQTYVGTAGTTVVNIPTPTQFITLKVSGGASDGHSLSYSTDGKIGVAGTGMDSTNGIFYIDGSNHLRNNRDPDGASFAANGAGEARVSFTASPPESRLNCTIDRDYALNCNDTAGFTTFRVCQNYLYVTVDDHPVLGGSSVCNGQPSVVLKAMYLSG